MGDDDRAGVVSADCQGNAEAAHKSDDEDAAYLKYVHEAPGKPRLVRRAPVGATTAVGYG